MKVRANNDIYRDGRRVVSEWGIYTVKHVLSSTYAVYANDNEIRILPKEFFTVVSEEGVE